MFHEMSRVTAINNQIQENSQPYLSCVDFGRVRPWGAPCFLFFLESFKTSSDFAEWLP